MLSNFDESEEEINLDLPMVVGKKKFSNIICESSEVESGDSITSENISGDDSANISGDDGANISDNIVDSDLESSTISRPARKTAKKSKKNQILSRDYIDNSDFDDNPLTLEEIAKMTQRSDSENDSDSFEVDEDGNRIKKSRTRKTKKLEDFVKTSEDFKSRLKFMSYDDSETDESERENENDSGSEFDDADAEDNIKDSNSGQRGQKLKMKKPKETLKNVLKESEALLRRAIPVDLEIEVPKPKTLDLILNEALAVNSRTPAEAKKRVIEEKRRIQRMKLEKILGSERMAVLIKDEPKIGHAKLDESVEIEIETVDEKAGEGDEIAKEIFKVKLTDLPDKHFDGKKSKAADSPGAGYKNYIQSQKKASIELLNIQLQEKIRAQSNVALLHHQRAHAAHLAAKRAKAEERERKRKEAEVKKERELREKKEKKAEGGELFKKEKYEGVQRRPINKYGDDDEMLGHEIRKPAGRIILSDDEQEDDGDGDIEDLLNLESEIESSSGTEIDTESEGLPDVNEAMDERVKDNEGLDGLLSGKFAEDHSEADSDDTVLSTKTGFNRKTETPRIKSMFIDDEASDEDEEKENDEIDEEALHEEMQNSNFIVESGESDFDPTELRAFVNEKAKKEDSEMEKKLFARFGNHLDDDEEDEFLNSLGNKYGLNEDDSQDPLKKKRSLVSQSSLDEDIRKLLDPIEQKKRKLAALGSLNILNRQRQVEAASDEFQFVKKTATTTTTATTAFSDCSSDYYATDDSDDSDDSDNGYYEEVESGLQSRVEEMLDEEMLDGEEVQVQATESLSAHLQTFNREDSEIKCQSDQNTSCTDIDSKTVTNIPQQSAVTVAVRGRGVAVPTVDAKLKSRLLALQQENDEISGAGNTEKFKGFSINK